MAWILFPFLWALSTSMRPLETLFTLTPEWLPHPATLENSRWALGEPTFVIPLRNSFLVSTGTAAISVALAAIAAYSLARFRYRGKNVVVAAMLGRRCCPRCC
jgi:ABC-type glycerol-3-phosphate transport system permease component